MSELSNATSSKAQLTRREREEVEKQKAKAHYQVLWYDLISDFWLNVSFIEDKPNLITLHPDKYIII